MKTGKFLTTPQTAIQPGKVDYEYDKEGKLVHEAGYDGRPIPKVKKYYSWDSIGIEGAYVIKENGQYYLFYSSWTRGYEIGYATASKITGPWKSMKEIPSTEHKAKPHATETDSPGKVTRTVRSTKWGTMKSLSDRMEDIGFPATELHTTLPKVPHWLLIRYGSTTTGTSRVMVRHILFNKQII